METGCIHIHCFDLHCVTPGGGLQSEFMNDNGWCRTGTENGDIGHGHPVDVGCQGEGDLMPPARGFSFGFAGDLLKFHLETGQCLLIRQS